MQGKQTRTLSFQQVDVFSSHPLRGNPLAVVMDADDLPDAQMAAFANWTNLSETTFLLRPQHPEADYRVRIFTPQTELPFAGHPTLGSCHAWLVARGEGAKRDIVQECAAGFEDPVTGSLNAGIARWLIGSGIAGTAYTAAQGTVLGREGRVRVRQDSDAIWIGGNVSTCITGTVSF